MRSLVTFLILRLRLGVSIMRRLTPRFTKHFDLSTHLYNAISRLSLIASIFAFTCVLIQDPLWACTLVILEQRLKQNVVNRTCWVLIRKLYTYNVYPVRNIAAESSPKRPTVVSTRESSSDELTCKCQTLGIRCL